jgi:ubiquinol-cytochrome c reductase cytochrome b subunit
MQKFRDAEDDAARQAERAIELCRALGIPPSGARTLMQNDPYLQGPILYKQHCAACHTFSPLAGEEAHTDFRPIASAKPVAPNLYNLKRKEWIAGFLDKDRIQSPDYFGNFEVDKDGNFVVGTDGKDGDKKFVSRFAKGQMFVYLRDTLPNELKEAKELAAELGEDGDPLDELLNFLVLEANRAAPLAQRTIYKPIPVSEEEKARVRMGKEVFASFSCSDCHNTYEKQGASSAKNAPDLRGYLSREWLREIIADPESPEFYGKGNEKMPAYHRKPEESQMSMEEIELLTDWLRGDWARPKKATEVEEKMQPEE